MTTVSKDFADNIARHQGWYNGDSDNSLGDNPRVVRIVEYLNAWGEMAYGLVFEGKPDKYTPSAYVRRPRVYWQLQPQGDDAPPLKQDFFTTAILCAAGEDLVAKVATERAAANEASPPVVSGGGGDFGGGGASGSYDTPDSSSSGCLG